MPKYCPKCGHSFPDDWDECNECEVELVYEEKEREIVMTEEEKKYYDDRSRHYLNREFINRGESLTFEAYPYKNKKEENIPKCPTCGSTNIRHITATERGVNAVMFGVFGTKRKHQFECQNPNCKYRW